MLQFDTWSWVLQGAEFVVHPQNLGRGSSTSSPRDLGLQLQLVSPEPEVGSGSGAATPPATACARASEHDDCQVSFVRNEQFDAVRHRGFKGSAPVTARLFGRAASMLTSSSIAAVGSYEESAVGFRGVTTGQSMVRYSIPPEQG